jgi:hypothetical protein
MEPQLTDQIKAVRTTKDVIPLIKKLSLPQRFARGLLKVWAQEYGITLTGEDFKQVVDP